MKCKVRTSSGACLGGFCCCSEAKQSLSRRREAVSWESGVRDQPAKKIRRGKIKAGVAHGATLRKTDLRVNAAGIDLTEPREMIRGRCEARRQSGVRVRATAATPQQEALTCGAFFAFEPVVLSSELDNSSQTLRCPAPLH